MARRRRSFHDFYDFPPPSVPRQAKGGIKSRSKRGAFGESWWAKRWIAVLESFDIGARLGRGRSYARRGQVLDVEVGKGTVSARVQGSRVRPYKVEIRVTTLSQAAWEKLAKVLSEQVIFAARLLTGDMPENIEEAFEKAGLSLFPSRQGDLRTSCSCPDWSNPCKHIAAVYYLLGEEFDRDPFLIFKLRGMAREELVGLVGKTTSTPLPEHEAAVSFPPEPLPAEPDAFWGASETEEDVVGEVHPPSVAAALPKRLGSFPFWRGEEDFLPALEAIYRQASRLGLEVFLGESKGSTGED